MIAETPKEKLHNTLTVASWPSVSGFHHSHAYGPAWDCSWQQITSAAIQWSRAKHLLLDVTDAFINHKEDARNP